MSEKRTFLSRIILDPLKQQLRQGSDPRGLARTIAAGVSLAIFPLLGTTTALCVLVGVRFRLNQPILQAVNYLMYPLQLALVPVFLLAGAKMTGSNMVSFNPKTVIDQFFLEPGTFLRHYGMAGFHAILVWLMVAPLVFKVAEILSLKSFHFLKKKKSVP